MSSIDRSSKQEIHYGTICDLHCTFVNKQCTVVHKSQFSESGYTVVGSVNISNIVVKVKIVLDELQVQREVTIMYNLPFMQDTYSYDKYCTT